MNKPISILMCIMYISSSCVYVYLPAWDPGIFQTCFTASLLPPKSDFVLPVASGAGWDLSLALILPPVELAEEDLKENHCPLQPLSQVGSPRVSSAREAQTDGPKHSRVLAPEKLERVEWFQLFYNPKNEKVKMYFDFQQTLWWSYRK